MANIDSTTLNDNAFMQAFGQVQQVRTEPGLYFRIPLIQEVVRYDARILGGFSWTQQLPWVVP